MPQMHDGAYLCSIPWLCMNKVYIFGSILTKSTQKLKCWPKVAAKKSKVEMLAKSGSKKIKS
jgi:hypothetical protein